MACTHFNSADNIKAPTKGTPVFKDDCMLCFDTAFEPKGLDICLHCFQSFSRGDLNHTQLHSALFDHTLYLNLKKVLKPKRERKEGEESPEKIAKLEIKDQSEEDLFNIQTALFCSSCDDQFPLKQEDLPASTNSIVETVLHSSSNERKEEIKSWEQEILPCHHCFDIVQQPIEDLDLTQCQSCDLKENLWICVVCGSLGCGRQQFGGIPGNSHALSHFESHENHNIAVKLGSLSSDSADCYCYNCNDEVKVPELGKYLSRFGINIHEVVKTEKNLTELQIEQNVKWDFNMDQKDGKSLVPVFGRELTGFKNLGNSCYLASVLQTLFSLRSYKEFFLNRDFPIDRLTTPNTDLNIQLIKIADGLLSGRYSIPDYSTTEEIKFQRGIKPFGFKNLIGQNHPEFSTMKQQDAYEFWLYIMDKIDELYVSEENPPNSPLHFVLENKLKCSTCSSVRFIKEVTNSLALPVEDTVLDIDDDGRERYQPVTFESCFKNWAQEEEIEHKCSFCQGEKLVKSQSLQTFPDVLTVSTERIKLKNWVPIKTDVPILFKRAEEKTLERIDLSNLRSQGLLEGESLMPEDVSDSEETGFEPNPEAIQQLEAMGFPNNRCLKALFNTGNLSAEDAMNWLFSHMEDPDIDSPFELPKDSSSSKPAIEPSQELVDNLVSMGFTSKLAKKALILNNINIEAAVEWLFSNPDDDGEIPDGPPKAKSQEQQISELIVKESIKRPEYKLLAVICHKGITVHSGHYVVFIKKKIDGQPRWILFNDEKVVLADEANIKEMESNGYLYIFAKVGSKDDL
ncbi:Ubiquitin carboxyl-terminal hydrolase 14 [Komagataella phaffii CBS 7435]|uniref:Ubiquitin carboxyl-terminal hydrolase n=2 Tax=Komagataella phaffii TaxID=460519 RepID=C4R608_KOMPG|nr:uncharacterized protein PAS_chr3_0933 [Komagataella phaffii GS115]AOA64302.1 GQ67_04062T0 [Komagataella phaffii]CAH2449187.1 Ubiquitin carboxyl-terminal hydrolase 14 [Komagataella phaffii CBS 7435]AOA69299.1 GQ68_04035T0 [Komagataella phaffii GS115]CAY70994.1 Ubiquitin-specific protease that specifically disassembles unanchored ubiquitin chains [Komagataella phaffii GS115]SCV12172.1 Ubiquitin carboxyl-terminal hydrolase 14 [Komagataella phaffii CBS 7435]